MRRHGRGFWIKVTMYTEALLNNEKTSTDEVNLPVMESFLESDTRVVEPVKKEVEGSFTGWKEKLVIENYYSFLLKLVRYNFCESSF